MTQYLLSVWSREGDATPPEEEIQEMYAATAAFNKEVQAEGAWIFAGGLEPASTATVVDGRKGEAVLTDGPFSESKEQLGGFWVIEAPDLDAAIEYARRGSAACGGQVEVRPFQSE